ncbi:MAG: lysylphosphatidylglycerol synthase transmembrane domain-containing protein [Phycisphaerae bacterium]
MTTNTRKWFINGVRITACGAAVWVVAGSVRVDDRVVLTPDNRVLVGRVVADVGGLVVHTEDAGPVAISWTQIAADEHGRLRIDYGLATAWRHASKPLLLLSIAVFMVVPLLQGLRLQWLLRAEHTAINLWTGVKISWAGNFLNFAAPLGSTAGDVAKAYYIAQHSTRKTEAMTVVFLDRALGLVCLLAVVAVITVLSPADTTLGALRMYMLGLSAVATIGAAAYLSTTLRRRMLPRGLLERLPMFDQLRRVDHTARSLAKRKRLLAGAVANTMVLQLVAAGAFFIVAMALGMTAGADTAVEYYAYFSTGEMVKALPGPPQGLGTAELAYQYFFAPFGSASQIVCAALAIRLVMLVCSLPGLVVTLTGACQPQRTTAPKQPHHPGPLPQTVCATSHTVPETAAHASVAA